MTLLDLAFQDQYVFVYNCVLDYKNNPKNWDYQAGKYHIIFYCTVHKSEFCAPWKDTCQYIIYAKPYETF